MSTTLTCLISYFLRSIFKSLASVCGSQETYTIPLGDSFNNVFRNTGVDPVLGGSITT